MAIGPRLDLRQAQSLVMTPQLQQAIKLLQMSNLDLLDYVEQELERNPLLERDDGPDDGLDDVRHDERTDTEVMLDSLPGVEDTPLDMDIDNLHTGDSLSDMVNDALDANLEMSNWSVAGSGGSDTGFHEGAFENTLSETPSLRDHLLGQINADLLDPVDRAIAAQLIDGLDEAGYLRVDPAELAVSLGCSLERIVPVLEACRRLDPIGVFARNLADCLALQLREKNRLDPAMQTLLDNLELLAKRDFPSLLSLCGVDREDLIEMISEIKALDPKPALAFDHTVAQSVVPDVIMRALPKGGWIVELNTETLPRVLVNSRYYARVSQGAKSKDDKVYLGECLQSANWLVKSLHQRATTILKVASEIVRHQDAFFEKGIEHLRPLVLREIAEAIEMHESTVSRVTSNKYMVTPRGIFELKYFFTQAIAASDGSEAHSAEAVRHRLKVLIDAESPSSILSDDKLVELLANDGIEIARRTVAKYREGLGISSSVQRRREKNSAL
ncbi:MAG: RNA polymerase sigma-54 factor [Alphaproteobacteria bacterium RIFOXYD12_FULL_60_8]|nr:MAG: RNA polymerase sigma-54 factor [Alphaproteobacteria bacterium RIFOXYD12_FULL_60_8]